MVEIVEALEAKLKAKRESGSGLEFEAKELANSIDETLPNPDIENWLSGKIANGDLVEHSGWSCPISTCKRVIDIDAVETQRCPYCETDFEDEGVEPIPFSTYRILGEVSRDIRWMLVVHGMNTRGQWQEEFSWRLGNKLKYSAPVLIYKYGWITIDVLVVWRHRQLANALGERIRSAIEFANQNNINAVPDVVVHSFGSHLFSLVLKDKKFDDLKFGRIITVGSIIRPDFDWAQILKTGRVQAVLNHVGAKDSVVPFSQYCIPGAAPGGREGHTDRSVINIRAANYGHSTCFEEAELEQNLREDGLWDRFLQHPLAQFSDENQFTPEKWKPAWALCRWGCRFLFIILFTVAAPFSFLRRLLDP